MKRIEEPLLEIWDDLDQGAKMEETTFKSSQAHCARLLKSFQPLRRFKTAGDKTSASRTR